MDALKKLYGDSFYRNSAAIILNTASGAIFGLVYWALAARLVPVDDTGLAIGIISISALIVNLALLGMDAGLVRFMPHADSRERLYNSITTATVVVSSVVSVAFIALSHLFLPGMRFGDVPVALLFMAFVVLNAILFIQNVAFIALRKGELSLVQNILLGIRIPLLVILAGAGTAGVLVSFILAYLAAIVFGVHMLRKNRIASGPDIDLPSLKGAFGFSLGNYVTSVFTLAPQSIIPVLIINTAGPEECTYFYIAYSIASFLLLIPGAVSSSLFVEGSHDDLARGSTARAVRLTLALLVPSVVFVFLFGDRLLITVFGAATYGASFEMLKLLAVTALFSTIVWIYIAVNRVRKAVGKINMIVILVASIILGGGYIGLRQYGLPGLGYAWMSAYIVASLVIVLPVIKKVISAVPWLEPFVKEHE